MTLATTPTQPELQQTARYWSSEGSWQVGRGLFWMELEPVQQRLNMKVSSDINLDWITYAVRTKLADRVPVERCLSLGCGEGYLERQLARLGSFQHCDANDIADGSIRIAQEAAISEGFDNIHYSVADLNQIELPTKHYDVVFGAGAVHHVARLEHLFEQVARTLKSSGLFILNEYVGPARFQFPEHQREIINACHALLPQKYLRIVQASIEQSKSTAHQRSWRWYSRRVIDKLQDGDLLNAWQRWYQRQRAKGTGTGAIKATPNLPTARSVAALDPSEAVRANEIRPLLEKYFDIVEYKPLGGTILQFLLADIAGNFDTPDGLELLNMLFRIEDTLMASGEIESDFAFIVARPRQTHE